MGNGALVSNTRRLEGVEVVYDVNYADIVHDGKVVEVDSPVVRVFTNAIESTVSAFICTIHAK